MTDPIFTQLQHEIQALETKLLISIAVHWTHTCAQTHILLAFAQQNVVRTPDTNPQLQRHMDVNA